MDDPAGLSGRVVLLGDPVAHSLSPAFQRAGFEALGLDLVYEPLQVSAEALPGVLAQLRSGALVGANVTLPHKEAASRLVDRLGFSAAWVGAVNTLVPTVYGIEGHNTDISGLRRTLEELLEGRRPARACVLGAGGTTRAAVVALEQLGCGVVGIANRTPGRAEALVSSLRERVRMDLQAVPLEALQQAGDGPWGAAEVVIHATSLGVGSSEGAPAWEAATAAWAELPWASWAAAGARCLDVSYGRPATPFVRCAEARGLVARDGLDMLLYQGLESFGLWTRRTPPEAVMRAALYAAAGRALP